jgi:SAM-dependent methyltransferase
MSWTQRKRAEIIDASYRPWLAGGEKVLDIGCGNGEVTVTLARSLGIDPHGTDIIDYRAGAAANLPFTLMTSPGSLPFHDRSFDVAMFNDILHHSDCVESLLLESKRLARKAIVVFEDCDSWLLRKVDVGLNRRYCADMPCPLAFRTSDEWQVLFAGLGFNVKKGTVRYPIWYPFRHMVFHLS